MPDYYNILIIEDQPLIAKTIQRKLAMEGYGVHIALDGLSAQEKISNYTYHCVITDINLPYASGIELINLIKIKQQKKIAVIALSGMYTSPIQLEALANGADIYLTKPLDFKKLIAVTATLIEKYFQE